MKQKFIFFLLAIASGCLYWLSYNYDFLWPLMLFAFVPLLYIVDQPTSSYRQLFGWGCLMGFVASIGVVFWYWSMLPLDWVGIGSPAMQRVAIAYAWLLSSTVGTVFGGLLAVLYRWLKRGNWFDLLLFPALGTSLSFIRSWAASIFLFGSGGIIGPHWTLGSNGYALASASVILPLAALGGVYILGFVAFLANGLIYKILLSIKARANWLLYVQIFTGVALVIVIFSSTYYRFLDQELYSIKVAVANTYRSSFAQVSPTEAVDKLGKALKLLRQVQTDKYEPDVIILPEDARVLSSLKVLGVEPVIDDLVGDREVLIVDSSRVVDTRFFAPTLELQFLNTRSGKLTTSDKLFLMPHGEYFPYITEALLKVIGQKSWTDNFEGLREVSKTKELNVADFRNTRVGAVACLEAMSPTINRELVNLGSGFIVNIASHALFNGSPVLYHQIFNMSKVRAIENNRYYIHAGNYVPSFVIDNKGRLLQESGWEHDSMLYQEVKVIHRDSIHNMFGRQLLALTLLLIIISAILVKFNLLPSETFFKNLLSKRHTD